MSQFNLDQIPSQPTSFASTYLGRKDKMGRVVSSHCLICTPIPVLAMFASFRANEHFDGHISHGEINGDGGGEC